MVHEMFLLVACLLAVALDGIQGHGMMMQPVSRSSAWRKGFPVPPNYNDNELFCGGMFVQFEQNGGKCGICGDNYVMARPRPNENGGVYGTGVIVARYAKGQVIDVNVKLTANHKGTFKFDLCPLKHSKQLEEESCFRGLQLENWSREAPVPSDKMEYNLKVRLPNDVTCEHCVLRWTYRGGNNWGDCGNGSSALGCGPQETFKNCADIAISG